MRITQVTSTVAAMLVFGAMAPVYGQHEGRGEKGRGGEKREEKREEKDNDKPGNRGRAVGRGHAEAGPRQEAHATAPQRSQQQAQTWQTHRGWLQQGGWQGQQSWQQGRAKNWDADHRGWSQRGGYGGSYVAQDRYSQAFGSQHIFRIGSLPVMYMGYPRFQYSGYSFLLVDPWPEYFASNWYGTDDVYIDYDEGYYLHNRRYPQIRLAVTVAL
jgi:hypothetical protein